MGDFREFMGEVRGELKAIRSQLAADSDWRDDHETHDDNRHREAMKAIEGIEKAREHEAGVAEGAEKAKAAERTPLMQRDAFGGMNVREAVSTIGIWIVVLRLIVQALTGQPIAVPEVVVPTEQAP